jgi:heme/copper-type cytochrome/quinol oxidase subunit 4
MVKLLSDLVLFLHEKTMNDSKIQTIDFKRFSLVAIVYSITLKYWYI